MNMQQMVQAMQKTQREFNKEYAKLEAKEFSYKTNGVVEVKILGDFTVKEISILDDDLLKAENKEELLEMIKIAFNNCKEQIQKENDELSSKFQGGFGGMKF